jgi:hypothetical protein
MLERFMTRWPAGRHLDIQGRQYGRRMIEFDFGESGRHGIGRGDDRDIRAANLSLGEFL